MYVINTLYFENQWFSKCSPLTNRKMHSVGQSQQPKAGGRGTEWEMDKHSGTLHTLEICPRFTRNRKGASGVRVRWHSLGRKRAGKLHFPSPPAVQLKKCSIPLHGNSGRGASLCICQHAQPTQPSQAAVRL